MQHEGDTTAPQTPSLSAHGSGDASLKNAPSQDDSPALAHGGMRRFVSFRLGEASFALPLERVERALRMVAPVELPRAPSWMLGVINLHGQVLPMLDLGQRLGAETRRPRPDQRLLIMSQEPRNLALLVDQVGQVLSAAEGCLEPPSGHLADSKVLAGVIKNGGELVLVLDPDRLAPLDWREHEDLFKAMEQQAAPKEEFDQP